jgi:hypothetical protein
MLKALENTLTAITVIPLIKDFHQHIFVVDHITPLR